MNEPRRVRAESHAVGFPVVVRGYDRRAVDAYVIRVNRLIAELEARRAPDRAAKRVLERAENERSSTLKQALETAEEITTAAQREAEETIAEARAEAVAKVVNARDEADATRAEADAYAAQARAEGERILTEARRVAADRLQRTEQELAAMREDAEMWLRALRIDTNVVWGERRDLVDDLRDLAARLQNAASGSGTGPGDDSSA